MLSAFLRRAPRAGLVLIATAALACGSDLVETGPSPDGVPGLAASLTPTTINGDRLRTTGSANIRSSSTVTSSQVGTQPANARGTVIGGPVTDTNGDGLVRWRINFDTGPDGWGADPYLARLPNVDSVALSPGTTALAVGTRVQLAAVLRDSLGNILTGEPIGWRSGNTAIATVSSSGLVTSIAAGTVTITGTSGRVSGMARITPPAGTRFVYGQRVRVANEPANIRSTSSSSGTLLGQQAVNAAGTVTGGPVLSSGDGLIRWRVDFDSGVDGWAGENWLAAMPPAVASIAASPDSVTMAIGDTLRAVAVARDSAGTTLSGMAISWMSRDSLVARVAATGLVSAVAAGTTYIIATSGGGRDSVRATVPSAHSGYFASPSGLGTNDGSRTRPWDLRTALAGGNGRVQPGDTIWMRGGTYTGTFRSTVRGTQASPVVVRQYPGERAIIDAQTSAGTPSVFYVGGEWSVFWGFEITNTNTSRTTAVSGNKGRPDVIVNYASHTRYVNLVVHDGGVAFYNEPQYTDVQIVGCIFYNNGWQGPDRGHGHALYLKSNTGPLIARDNVIFNQFGYGVHGYSNAGSGRLVNIRLEGNVSFNNGSLATGTPSANILLGGADYATDDVLRDNMTYRTPGASGTNVRVGYGTLQNGSVQLANNYFIGGSPVLEMNYWTSPTLTGNTLIGSSTLARLNDPTLTLAQLLGGNVITTTRPSSPRVFVRPDTWEAGRAMVVVYNWSGQGSVTADLSPVLSPGDRFEIRSVQDLYGTPVAVGTYAGGALIPLRAITPPAPIGSSARGPITGPAFDVFIVKKM